MKRTSAFFIHVDLLLYLIACLAYRLNSIYKSFLENYQLCSVEVWGPRRFCDSRDDDTSYDLHKDRLYLKLLDYLLYSKAQFFTADSTSPFHVSADNNFEYKLSASDTSKLKDITNAKKPIVFGLKHNCKHKILYKESFLTLERVSLPNITYLGYSYEKIRFTATLKDRHPDSKTSNKIQIYKPKSNLCTCCADSWEENGPPRNKRPLHSVMLKAGLKEDLAADLKDFLESRDWYASREIPYSRGYLLYGPPGNGKSSLVKALASEFDLSVCILSLSAKDLTHFSLSRNLNSAPHNSIILIEDIDAAFKSREDEFADSTEQTLSFGGANCASVSFSDLLNALDGVLAGGADGRIVFITTNYIDRLDPALIRPGRIDRKVCIDYPDDEQICNLFRNFHMGRECDGEAFVKCVRACSGGVRVNMSMIQGLLTRFQTHFWGESLYDQVGEYFEEQVCSYRRRIQDQWGLYT